MDAIVPAACPVATRESSVRADTDESDASRRTEAEETVILVTTSRNKLSLEGQRVAYQGYRRETPSLCSKNTTERREHS